MKYGDINLGQIEAAINTLGGMRGFRLLLSGEMDVKEKTPRTWVDIRLGTFKTTNEILKAFKCGGINIEDMASMMLNNPAFNLAVPETNLKLVKMTTERLAGKDGMSSTAEVFAGARRYMIEDCLAEVGPQLRLLDLTGSKDIYIGMKPILCMDGIPRIFNLSESHFGTRWPRASVCRDDVLWNGQAVWVFARRKLAKSI